MTSERISHGRRERMLQLAAAAPAILSPETEPPKNRYWYSKKDFLESYPTFSEDRPWKDDDQDVDVMALFVLDDFPVETLNEVLRVNTAESDEPYLWLADTYDTLPDWDPQNPAQGTSGPLDQSWRSPFIGASVQEVAAFVQAVPKPPKALCKRFFAVLQKERFEQNKQLLIYKILDDSGDGDKCKLQMVPCPV